MSINQKIEEIVSHIIHSQKNIDVWEEYEENIIRNFELINFEKIIENYKPCEFQTIYISNYNMSGILYKNIVLNDNLFIELFKNSRYPRKECNFTGNNVWDLIEKCVYILVKKQTYK